MATPKQTDPQFKLRLPAELKDRIDKAAEAHNRSINAEIVDRLEASFGAQSNPEALATAKSVVRDLILARSIENSSDLDVVHAEYRAALFLRDAPIEALEEFDRWSSDTMKIIVDRHKDELTRDTLREVVDDAIERALAPIAEFMRKRGWNVRRPPTPFDEDEE